MADQIFNVDCGFFNAVDNDRTYSADDMNMPYKRFITNGVLYGDDGLPGTDLLVETTGGMTINVNPGNGLFADKWFENPAGLSIEVPANTDLQTRIDSVIVQVDKRASGRAGNIVYRTGTTSAPAINTIPNVVEYRLANIRVAAGASAITNEAITDKRGTSECPWATSKVQPLDHVCILTSSYTTSTRTSQIPILTAGYNPNTDSLTVFINGIYAEPNVNYNLVTPSQDVPYISLTYPLSAGQKVYFFVIHNYLADGLQNVQQFFIQTDQTIAYLWGTVYDDVYALKNDSGWKLLAPTGSIVPYSVPTTPAYRKFGNMVHLRGAVKNITSANIGTTIFTLPTGYEPGRMCFFTTSFVNSSNAAVPVAWSIDTNGNVVLLGIDSSITATDMITIDTNFILGAVDV